MKKFCAGGCGRSVPVDVTRCPACQGELGARRVAEGHTGQNGVRRDQGVRARAIARDGGCVRCGMTNSQHEALYGKGLEVHHRDGDPRNNSLANLETLCRPHHDDADIELRRQRPRSWREAREAL